jgi:hypothetical protein
MKKDYPNQLAAAVANPNAGFMMIGKAARGFFGLIGDPAPPTRRLLGTSPEAQRTLAKRTRSKATRGKAAAENRALESRRRRLREAEASLKPRKRSAAKTRRPYRGALHHAAELEKRRQILARLVAAEKSRDFFPTR